VLMDELPQMGARISRAAHDRLPGL
jgi:hypothetical protein